MQVYTRKESILTLTSIHLDLKWISWEKVSMTNNKFSTFASLVNSPLIKPLVLLIGVVTFGTIVSKISNAEIVRQATNTHLAVSGPQGGTGIQIPCGGRAVSSPSLVGHRGGRQTIIYEGTCTTNATSNVSWIRIESITTVNTHGSFSDSKTITIKIVIDSMPDNRPRTGSIVLSNSNFVPNRITINQQVIPENCPSSSYTVAPISQFTDKGGSANISVNTPFYCKWSVRNTDDWLTVDNSSNRVGQGIFTISAIANDFGDPRTTTINLSNDQINIPLTVSQEAGCTMRVALSSNLFSYEGGVGNISITTNKTSCPWSIGKIPSWINFQSSYTGTGNQILNFQVLPNNGDERKDLLCIGKYCFTVVQEYNPIVTCSTAPAISLPWTDLGMIRKINSTTPSTEVYFLSSASSFNKYSSRRCSQFTQVEGLWSYALLDWNNDNLADLAGIKTIGTPSGRPEVTILSGAQSYNSSLLSSPIPLGVTGATDQYYFADYNADGKQDLFQLRRGNTGSGSAEIMILSGSSNLSTTLLNKSINQTAIGESIDILPAYWDADLIPDLLIITKNNTTSGFIEIKVLSGLSTYGQIISTIVTKLPAGNTGLEFEATDWDGDERIDLVVVEKRNTLSGKIELQILTNASNYTKSAGRMITQHEATGDQVEFSMPTLAPTVPRRRGSYDQDVINDPLVWRPTTAGWYLLPTTRKVQPNFEQQYTSPDGHPYFLRALGFPSGYSQQVKIPIDVPVPADYDGDGVRDLAVWRPHEGMWYIIPSSGSLNLKSRQFKLLDGTTYYAVQLGLNGDIPVPGYYDKDSLADMAVWRPRDGRWYVLPSTGDFQLKQGGALTSPDGNPYFLREFGNNSQIPVPADYDGDRLTDLGLWEPRNGKWSILTTSGASPAKFVTETARDGTRFHTLSNFGRSGDIPVVGQYDNDIKADIAIWRPSSGIWNVLPSTGQNLAWTNKQNPAGFPAYGTYWRAFGQSNAVPVPADFDGDGVWDPAVWEPNRGNWHILATTKSIPFSTNNTKRLEDGMTEFIVQLGLPGDIPLGRAVGN